jgi:hypothetical protein
MAQCTPSATIIKNKLVFSLFIYIYIHIYVYIIHVNLFAHVFSLKTLVAPGLFDTDNCLYLQIKNKLC